ncbi:hypothetical protein SUGI_1001680 [Cryptomeria japonica]|nr:hypothetical protein SUGI_1001680 [Cryptomeria japonica]
MSTTTNGKPEIASVNFNVTGVQRARTQSESYGSKDEAYFDSVAVWESDCDEDFFSINGDFLPSAGNTMSLPNSVQGTPRPSIASLKDRMMPVENKDRIVSDESYDRMISLENEDKMVPFENEDKMVPFENDNKMVPFENEDKMVPFENDNKMVHGENDNRMVSLENEDKMIPVENGDRLVSFEKEDGMVPVEIKDGIIPDESKDRNMPIEKKKKLKELFMETLSSEDNIAGMDLVRSKEPQLNWGATAEDNGIGATVVKYEGSKGPGGYPDTVKDVNSEEANEHDLDEKQMMKCCLPLMTPNGSKLHADSLIFGMSDAADGEYETRWSSTFLKKE